MALHEECGVFGIYDFDGGNVAPYVAYGLVALQHRGQESCGIAITRDREVASYKDLGLVADVLTQKVLDSLDGNMAIGHVRYSTASEVSRENAQPLVMHYKKGTLSLAHNGNLSNRTDLRDKLAGTGAVFQTTTDAETIAYLIAKERIYSHSVEEAICKAMLNLKGAYSLLVMSPQKLIAVRDPYGFRPLVIGKMDNAYVFASETCALDAVGADYVRDVEPGEVVMVDQNGLTSVSKTPAPKPAPCIFEYIYFSRPDSVMDGVSVLKARQIAGQLLAKQHPVEADVVIGVPDSGIDAAVGYAKGSGIPYERGFIKNGYVGRSFIKPKQSERALAVKLKINPLGDNIRGKRVVMIDDSIVRGTTSAKIVKMLRDAGAKEVHMRVASPHFLWPCYFGTDIPDRSNLASVKYSDEELCKIIGADSLGFLDINCLHELVGKQEFCKACFSGEYPYDVHKKSDSEDL
ncbi:MAG: amidophosphoribosyltransferase [Clostridia bacterium]|nr:amidophosphoribosyltransferase [Clostridia bacterium]